MNAMAAREPPDLFGNSAGMCTACAEPTYDERLAARQRHCHQEQTRASRGSRLLSRRRAAIERLQKMRHAGPAFQSSQLHRGAAGSAGRCEGALK